MNKKDLIIGIVVFITIILSIIGTYLLIYNVNESILYKPYFKLVVFIPIICGGVVYMVCNIIAELLKK